MVPRSKMDLKSLSMTLKWVLIAAFEASREVMILKCLRSSLPNRRFAKPNGRSLVQSFFQETTFNLLSPFTYQLLKLTKQRSLQKCTMY